MEKSPLVLTSSPEPVQVLLRRLWGARELIAVLTRREFFVRYRRASLGILWAAGMPIVQAVVIVAVFSRVVQVPTTAPYVTFVFAGMCAWIFISSAVVTASTAIVDGQSLSSRIYFPRAVLPLVMVGANLFALAIMLTLLLLTELIDTRHIGVEILLLVPAAVLATGVAIGFGLVNSAVHVYLRDVRFLVQAALLVWFYITPVFYPLDKVSGVLRVVVITNPITGVVEVMRAATVGADGPIAVTVAISAAWALGLIACGLLVHARFDRLFADLL